MTPEQYHTLNDRIDYLEDLITEIRDKLNSPDYNLSITIPAKPVDCIGECHTVDPNIMTSAVPIIPWE